MSALKWWQNGVIYQIYPRSFRDCNNDGIGDLVGITEKLPYLQSLGIDAIWISPIYPSPMADFGYDVSDYCNIDPRFGDLEAFDHLVQQAHTRNIKVILDFVPNHTSDQHPWFIESRSTRRNAKRDWYIWRDPSPDGGPPNNWLSNFGGSAWEFDPASGQYYYHAFLKAQPDLNWRNPEVRAAMYDVLRFWLNRGVDGFRIDVIYHILKDVEFRDNPINPSFDETQESSHRVIPVYSLDQPEVQDILAEMRDVVDEYEERLIIGEIYLPLERLVAYYGNDLRGAHLPFNFLLIGASWEARTIEQLIRDYESALPAGGWPNWVLGNHDKPRIATRIGQHQARVAAMLLLTLRGTPTLYYGDELGMENVPIPVDEVQDPFEHNEPGKGLGRDPQRTPMQWNTSDYAGFSSTRPWLRLGPDWPECNVETLSRDPYSLLNLYRQLLALRRSHPALTEGNLELLPAEGDLLAYRRSHGTTTITVLLNMGSQAIQCTMPEKAQHLLLSTDLDHEDAPLTETLTLNANEGILLIGA